MYATVSPALKKVIEREAENLKKIAHENIIKFYECFFLKTPYGQAFYMVTELFEVDMKN
jgi:serine/threonine protein kinase